MSSSHGVLDEHAGPRAPSRLRPPSGLTLRQRWVKLNCQPPPTIPERIASLVGGLLGAFVFILWLLNGGHF